MWVNGHAVLNPLGETWVPATIHSLYKRSAAPLAHAGMDIFLACHNITQCEFYPTDGKKQMTWLARSRDYRTGSWSVSKQQWAASAAYNKFCSPYTQSGFSTLQNDRPYMLWAMFIYWVNIGKTYWLFLIFAKHTCTCTTFLRDTCNWFWGEKRGEMLKTVNSACINPESLSTNTLQ